MQAERRLFQQMLFIAQQKIRNWYVIGNSFKIESRNGELCIKCLAFFVCLFANNHWIGTTIEEHAYTILGIFGCVVANVWVGFSDLYFISTIHTMPLSWQTEWNRMVEDPIWGSYSVVSNLRIIAQCANSTHFLMSFCSWGWFGFLKTWRIQFLGKVIIMDMGSKGKNEWNQRKHTLHCWFMLFT